MKKTIKTILIIIFFICFLGLFLRPRPVFAEDINAYTAITQFRDYMQAEDNAVLSQFYTYSYLGLTYYYSDGSTVSYRVNLVVDSIYNSSSSGYDYVTYYPAVGSYYYTSDDNYSVARPFTGAVRIQYYNTARQVVFLSSGYWFYVPSGLSSYGLVDYCDLADSYYSNHADGSSLVKHNLYTLPTSFNGTISTPSFGDTLGDSIDKSIDTVAPAPIVTTVPPFAPPATVPPILPPTETITALPAVTDDSNNYYVDYSPYIDGAFYAPPATDDISLSPALSASGAIISEGFGLLTDSGVFSVLLVLMLVSFAIYNLI